MRNKKGLTLVEVVVAMGLFGIIMVALFPAFLITNLMNITSREFTDANFHVQTEMEEIYNASKATGATASSVLTSLGYTCVSTTCTKDDGDYHYSATFNTYKDPVTNNDTSLTSIVLTVSKIQDNPTIGEERASLQLVLKFGEDVTP